MGKSWLKTRLDELGITAQQAAVICDISGATMEIVVSGYPTLPQLAIKIAKGLGLTREEARPLGQALDAKQWGRDGLPPANKVDADPEWYKAIPEKRKADGPMAIGSYVDTLAVLLKMPVKQVATVRKPEVMRIIRFEPDPEAVEELMRLPQNNRHALAKKMFCGANAGGELKRLMARIRAQELLTVDLAVKLADALGVETGKIGRRVVKTY